MDYKNTTLGMVLIFFLVLVPAVLGQREPTATSGNLQNAQERNSQLKPFELSVLQSPPAAPATSAIALQEKQPQVKPGSKDDVGAIGNRNIGGKGLGNWYSIEREVAMGREYAAVVESSARMLSDPVITEYVNRLGQDLVRNSDAKVPFTIKVIDSGEVNAFALPGGFFYVNSGLVLATDEEAELAGVMAHEIAHVAAHHATRQMTRSNLVNLASIPLIFVGGGIGYGIRTAAGLGLPMTFLHFSRGFEEEADFLGLQYMYKAGYDPQAYIAFLEKIQAQRKEKAGTLSKAFSTHPQASDRIKKAQREIVRILPARDQYVISTSEFDYVKSRLVAIENRGKIPSGSLDNKPSLRRQPANKSGEEDHPTLKRYD